MGPRPTDPYSTAQRAVILITNVESPPERPRRRGPEGQRLCPTDPATVGGPTMFQVQRAGVGGNAAWKTICTHASESYARQTYQRQLQLNSVGRFRLLGPEGQVLAEARARPLFDRSEADEEQRPPTYYAPP